TTPHSSCNLSKFSIEPLFSSTCNSIPGSLVRRYQFWIAFESSFERALVDFARVFDGSGHTRLAIYLDFEIPGSRFADNLSQDAVIRSYLLDSCDVGRVAGDHHPAGIFSEQNELSRQLLRG